MRIPTLGALTLAAAAAVVAVPTAANAAPLANPDSATTTTGVAKSFNVLTNDTKDAATTWASISTTTPGHGAVSCATDGNCTYTPTTGWSGTDNFTYTVADSAGGSATGNVSVETVAVSNITIASTPTTNLAWPKFDPAAAPVAPTAKFTGVVKKSTSAGSVVAQGVEVQLMAKPTGASSYTAVPGKVAVSSDKGVVSVSGVAPSTFTSYKWKAGNYLSGLSSLSVTPSLTTKFTPGTLARTATVAVSGMSGPATGGETVELQRRNATTGVWESTGMLTTLGSPTDGYAGYSFELPSDVSGKFTYRVVRPQAGGLNAVASGQTSIKRYDAKVQEVHPADADETVIVKNNGKVAVNLLGWALRQGTKEAVLPKWTLAVGDTVIIHSGRGINKGRNLYLKGADRWNASGTVTLFDKRNVELHHLDY
ncbi:MAG TPA: Ig-like domain-containing protein [Nocardioides sp.]|jgi:hypothetical protein|nr:Ig-like domain-containing protein [Nocardioides sp.]